MKTPVTFEVPPGACDCHVHVIPDPAKFPFWTGRAYTPPVDPPESLLALQHALKLDRVVIVTPSVYGTDNAATLDGLRLLGPERARGVAVIGPGTSTADLDALVKAGIRGIRVNLEQAGVFDPAVSAKALDSAVQQIGQRPWHLQVYSRLPVIAPLKQQFSALPVPVVFDHFAGAQAALGPDQPGFNDVLDLVRSGKAWVKLSGAYRASNKPPDYPDVLPLARSSRRTRSGSSGAAIGRTRTARPDRTASRRILRLPRTWTMAAYSICSLSGCPIGRRATGSSSTIPSGSTTSEQTPRGAADQCAAANACLIRPLGAADLRGRSDPSVG
ncbi:amidohydrolase family protein [Methylobacterium oryzae CBMB20]